MGRAVPSRLGRIRGSRLLALPPGLPPHPAGKAVQPVRPTAEARPRRSSAHFRTAQGPSTGLRQPRSVRPRPLLHLLGLPLIHGQLRRLHLRGRCMAAVLRDDFHRHGRPHRRDLPRPARHPLPRRARLGRHSPMDHHSATPQLRPDPEMGVSNHPPAHRRADAAFGPRRGHVRRLRRCRPHFGSNRRIRPWQFAVRHRPES